MKDARKICKHCGYITLEKICPSCNQNGFAEKHKGKAVIFDVKNSIVAGKINAKTKGQYALKYN